MKLIKVGIVDDHTLLRGAIARLLASNKNFKVVLEAADGVELLDIVRKSTIENRPDVILLDINMPRMDGFEAFKILSSEYPSIKAIICSMFTDEGTILRALKLGVAGYLAKNEESEQIFRAVTEVANGGVSFSHSVSTFALKNLSLLSDSSKVSFSEKELAVIQGIFLEMTTEELAKELFISKRTIDTHVQNIMNKLKVKTRVGIVVEALRKNLISLDYKKQ